MPETHRGSIYGGQLSSKGRIEPWTTAEHCSVCSELGRATKSTARWPQGAVCPERWQSTAEWFALEEALKITYDPTDTFYQTRLFRATSSLAFNTSRLHSFSGEPALVPHHPYEEEFPPNGSSQSSFF